jgi:drug/metabolite transporter (DMT)-like permease
MISKDKIHITILLILISLAWAGSFIVVRLSVSEISPNNLGFFRFLIATPFMFFILIFRKKKIKMPLKEIPKLMILGLSGVTFLYIFQFTGIEYTNASTASILINTNVIFIAILSFIFLNEVFSIKKSAGIILSFIGVFVVLLGQMSNVTIIFNLQFLIGSFFVILSAFCWAIYSIVGKNLLITYDPFIITTYSFVFGIIFYLPFIFKELFYVIQNISINSLMAILYLALVCSVFGYSGWYYILTKTTASRAAVFLNLIPLFAISLSFFIGEIPTFLFLIGAMLIIYGVYLTQRY